MYDVIIFTENTDPMQIAIPLGGFKVASVLRKNGFSTLVVNHLSTYSMIEIKNLIDLVVNAETKVIGFSTTFLRFVDTNTSLYTKTNLDTVFPQGKAFEDEVINYIKYKNDNIKIIVGGTKTSATYYNTNIDYVFLGYSETSIIDLMNHLTIQLPLPNSIVNQHGITVIDDRKALSYKFTEDKMIWEKTDIVNHKLLPIEIGRGCIFKCKFCSYPLNGKKNLDFIKNSEIIYEELLENYTKFGIVHYFIVDDTFNDHIIKLKAIEAAVARLPFQPKFWCYTRLDLLCTNKDMVDVMYNIGVRAMYFGIETLNLQTGRTIGKGYDRVKQIAMIQYIKDRYPDVAMHGSFIAGLPNESVESIKQTCFQLANGEIPLDSWMIRPFLLFKPEANSFMSELDANYENYGYNIEATVENLLLWKNEHLSIKEASDLSTECITHSRNSEYFRVPGHDSFELINFGYNFETTSKTPFNRFRYDIVMEKDVPKFIETYKTELLSILGSDQKLDNDISSTVC